MLKQVQHDEENGQKAGAGEGNRTLVVSLEGFCSTIELHPRRQEGPLAILSRCGALPLWAGARQAFLRGRRL